MASTTNNHETLNKFTSCVALISPQHVNEINAMAHAPQRGVEQTEIAMQQCASNYGIESGNGKPFLFAGGVAVIPVWGALLHRDRWCDSWATGYDYISSKLAAALGDPDVKGIWWDINSYGGHVAGNFELCELIYEARAKKPMAGLIDTRCFSGGYSIGSSIGKLYSTPSGEAGSIGVVMMHASFEQMLSDAGIDITFIYAGKHKVDGNAYKRLSKGVKEDLQASVDRSYEKFVALVARNRGMEPEAVRETEARIFDAEEAQSLGLIDAVMLPRAAFAEFTKGLESSPTPTKEAKKAMSDNTNNGEGGQDTATQVKAATEQGKKAGFEEGQKAAMERFDAIMSCNEAQGKEKLARTLAMTATVTVEQAKTILAASAAEKPETKAEKEDDNKGGNDRFAAAMDNSRNPNMGKDNGDGGDGGDKMSIGQRIVNAGRKVGMFDAPKAN